MRVSYRGEGKPGISPPEILKLSIVIIVVPSILAIYVTEHDMFVPDCVRSNLRGSKFKIFLGGMPPDPPSRHARISCA